MNVTILMAYQVVDRQLLVVTLEISFRTASMTRRNLSYPQNKETDGNECPLLAISGHSHEGPLLTQSRRSAMKRKKDCVAFLSPFPPKNSFGLHSPRHSLARIGRCR